MQRLFGPQPHFIVLPLLVGDGGAKRRVRVNRVFSATHMSNPQTAPVEGLIFIARGDPKDRTAARRGRLLSHTGLDIDRFQRIF